MSLRRSPAAALALCLLTLAACAPGEPPPGHEPERVALVPVGFDALPGWSADAVAETLPALLLSCRKLDSLAETHAVGRDGSGGTVADWRGPCRAAQRLPAGDHAAARVFFESWFVPHLVTTDGAKGEGLFTGYYEVEMTGSLTRHGPYQTPVFGRPADLVTVDLGLFRDDLRQQSLSGRLESGRLKPYPERARIEQADTLPAPVLAWAADPADVFLMHVQGSGRVQLDDGRTLRLGYAADNGRKFVGIAQKMIDRGLVERSEASMMAIRAWLRRNPDKAREIMAENPRYIFFKTADGDGPIGAQGVALTPGRSLAVDPKFIPLGVPVWLDTTVPGGGPLRRLVMAQDTGSAITGPVRGDYFWGRGDAALEQAGRMKSRGRYFLLLPRSRGAPVA